MRKNLIILIVVFSLIFLSVYLINISKNIISYNCIPNEKKCDGNNAVQCSYSGSSFVTIEECANGCLGGFCKKDNQICSSGESFCLGDKVSSCNSDGSNYSTTSDCQQSVNGLCKFSSCVAPTTCKIGETRCANEYSQICFPIDNTNYWISTKKCAFKCSNGNCVSPTEYIPRELPTHNTLPKFSDNYETSRIYAGIPNEYLKETGDYDYVVLYDYLYRSSNTNKFDLSINDPELMAEEIAMFTFENIDYNTDTQSVEYCERNSAFDIFVKKKGVCSTMSKLNVALLRGVGLAAREVSGCLTENPKCASLALYPNRFSKRYKNPLKLTIKKEKNKYVLGGGPHSWVEVWLPERGWTFIESTNGLLYSDDCLDYNVYCREGNFLSNEGNPNYCTSCAISKELGNKCLSF